VKECLSIDGRTGKGFDHAGIFLGERAEHPGEKIEVGLFFYPRGTEAKLHAHPNEQIMVILKGKGKWRIGKEEKVLGPGEAVLIPPNIEHEVHILEDLELINCKDVVPDGV